jgi:hypothetical protein
VAVGQAAVQERRPRQVEKVECCLIQARGVVAKFDGLLLGVASHLQVFLKKEVSKLITLDSVQNFMVSVPL